ncbi:exodeoxyribonuclease V subunit alpha [Utexia brackfieldae]|uniref:exodeoxyribonuclease V subunit alpha n=1 Tax=Utexia brackfieldae TaxID=3074108 RepID=UPI00370D8102
MISLFQQAVEKKLFSALDVHLGSFLADKTHFQGIAKQRFHFLISYLSAQTRAGHVCISVDHLTQTDLFAGREASLITEFCLQLDSPSVSDWQQLLAASTIVSTGETNTPLIWQHERLYFQRLWLDEQKVSHYFCRMSQSDNTDISSLTAILEQLFPDNLSVPDWQKIAVATALTRQVAIISGGPGTGKTTTVAKLLAALVLGQLNHGKPLRIMAAAPTGKAAARLTESLNQAMGRLLSPKQINLFLPNEAVTLHRLLGVSPHSAQFTYHHDNPLHVDILIIDEASMVDLSMMASIIDALPAQTRLVLLGDREQLSSVEAGAVLGDLCSFAQGEYTASQALILKQLTGYDIPTSPQVNMIADNICLLQKSYRFQAHSGIGQLASYIKQGDSYQARQLLLSQQYPDIEFCALAAEQDYPLMIEQVARGYHDYLQYIQTAQFDISNALRLFGRFRLLAALREGKFGVNGLNRQIEALLVKQGLIMRSDEQSWYLGRPVMILKNYPELGLYNGDIGITLPSTADRSKKRVYFEQADGSVKGLSPYRLPLHETVFVMTVHKSQGSEFEHTALVLPTEYNPLLTRSLLYTAVTRAKQKMTLYSRLPILEKCIQSQIERQTGLVDNIIQAS